MGLASGKQNGLQVEVKLGTNCGMVGVWELYLTEDTQLESWMTACQANGGGISCFILEVALGTSQGPSLSEMLGFYDYGGILIGIFQH